MSDIGEVFPDYCGIMLAVNVENAARVVRNGSLLQQNRGEKGYGITTVHGDEILFEKRLGTIDEGFPASYDFKNLPGRTALGHNRYATKGGKHTLSNIQPFVYTNTKFGQLAFCHNGQLVDNEDIKGKLISEGTIFQSNSDSELLPHLVFRSHNAETLEDAVMNSINAIPTAYSAVFMTPKTTVTVRDQYGVRPLSIAKYKGGFLMASENVTFRMFPEAKLIREVEPGEMIIFREGEDDFESRTFADANPFPCAFEPIYFDKPRTTINGSYVEDFRQGTGRKIYQERREFFDKLRDTWGDNIAVVPVMNSGHQGAIGFAKSSKIPYKQYIDKRHHAPSSGGRTFLMDDELEREQAILMKYDFRMDKMDGKYIITVDDSLVRGNTARIINKILRNPDMSTDVPRAAGIINVSLSPMIKNICYLGIDFQTLSELATYQHQTEGQIAKATGADYSVFLSLNGLNEEYTRHFRTNACTGCFGGNYPIKKF